ncbi:MAG TPA: tetratricopeptide repeat protein [Vicinamibacteria bacterium]|nr:tetratricopeptide repeat protein [Vicinamibacteria bacterium]
MQLQRLRSKTLLFILALSLASAVSSLSADTKPEDLSKKQVEFGIDVARLGLWREAVYRWQRAVELDPSNASARNNLGVAYEQAGQFDLAEEQYQRALELDTNNVYIRQNYELFREAYEKRKRKDGGSTP